MDRAARSKFHSITITELDLYSLVIVRIKKVRNKEPGASRKIHVSKRMLNIVFNNKTSLTIHINFLTVTL